MDLIERLYNIKFALCVHRRFVLLDMHADATHLSAVFSSSDTTEYYFAPHGHRGEDARAAQVRHTSLTA